MTYVPAMYQRLGQPLPGTRAHTLMAPSPPLSDCVDPVRESAVLALLSPVSHRLPADISDLHVTLIRRGDSSQHAFELAFPGGVREGNETLVDTALREAGEELGLDSAAVEVMGTLTPVTTFTSQTSILPVLALARCYPDLNPNEEVASILHIPLKVFLRPNIRGLKVVYDPQVGRRRIPYYHLGAEDLWGASAKIMAELLTVVFGDEYLKS